MTQICLFTRTEAVTAVTQSYRLALVSRGGSPALRRPRYQARQEKMNKDTRGLQPEMEGKKESLILDVVSSRATVGQDGGKVLIFLYKFGDVPSHFKAFHRLDHQRSK